jgi:hypothetical protein
MMEGSRKRMDSPQRHNEANQRRGFTTKAQRTQRRRAEKMAYHRGTENTEEDGVN